MRFLNFLSVLIYDLNGPSNASSSLKQRSMLSKYSISASSEPMIRSTFCFFLLFTRIVLIVVSWMLTMPPKYSSNESGNDFLPAGDLMWILIPSLFPLLHRESDKMVTSSPCTDTSLLNCGYSTSIVASSTLKTLLSY